MADNAFHLSLNVANLEYSVGFYRILFGVEPAKWFPDYAKFQLSDPALVLSLEPAKAAPGGTLNHLGLRVNSVAQIDAFEKRLAAVGVPMQRLTDIECCYSRQSKIVFRDPDQNLIEVYVVEGESDARAKSEVAMPTESTVAAVASSWEHLIGSPFPIAIPAKDGTLSEVRLRGTFNGTEEFRRAADILIEAKRALRDGGQLLVHLLVANQELRQALPPLPPPADQVRTVPTERAVTETIESAGFSHLELKRLSHSPVMQLGDVELREFLLHARKPVESASDSQSDVVYKGPYAKLEDDRGRVFRRGERVAVSSTEIEWLGKEGWLEDFVVLNAPTKSGAQCGPASA